MSLILNLSVNVLFDMQTPGQIAKRAHVTAQTIRNYTVEYAELLAGATRGENGARLYSDEDAEILCTIASLRKSGVPSGEIAGRLRNREVPPIIDVEPQMPSNEAQEGPKAGQEAAYALQLVHGNLLSRVEALERRADARANQLVTGIVIGVAIALVVVSIALSMAR